jgi:hypothetical protein
MERDSDEPRWGTPTPPVPFACSSCTRSAAAGRLLHPGSRDLARLRVDDLLQRLVVAHGIRSAMQRNMMCRQT